jgi:spore coat protein U-like protein
MTLPRALATALTALVVLIGPLAVRLAAQYPKGLLSTTTTGCIIETRPVAFGAYDVLSYFALSAQGQVVYTCTSGITGAPRNIRIELSTGGAGTYRRRMASGVEHLDYNLYLDASHHSIWGNGANGTDYYFASFPPANTPIVVPIYAQLPARQDVKVGFYSDALYARILF